jgi:hypothetical protein
MAVTLGGVTGLLTTMLPDRLHVPLPAVTVRLQLYVPAEE